MIKTEDIGPPYFFITPRDKTGFNIIKEKDVVVYSNIEEYIKNRFETVHVRYTDEEEFIVKLKEISISLEIDNLRGRGNNILSSNNSIVKNIPYILENFTITEKSWLKDNELFMFYKGSTPFDVGFAYKENEDGSVSIVENDNVEAYGKRIICVKLIVPNVKLMINEKNISRRC